MRLTAFLAFATLGLAADNSVISLFIPDTDPQPLEGTVLGEVGINEKQLANDSLTIDRTHQPQRTASTVHLVPIARNVVWVLVFI